MTIAIVLLVLWILGLVTSSTMGGLIHVLLVIAVVMILVNVIQGSGSSSTIRTLVRLIFVITQGTLRRGCYPLIAVLLILSKGRFVVFLYSRDSWPSAAVIVKA
jgi:hypothetical protein